MKRKLLQSFNTLKSHICLAYRTIFMNKFRSTIVDASEGPYDPIVVATQTNNPTLQQADDDIPCQVVDTVTRDSDDAMETDGGAAVDDIIFKIAKRSVDSDAMGTNGGPGHEDNRTRSMYAHRRSLLVHRSLPMEPSHERKIRKMRQRALYNKQHADADEPPSV